MQPKDCVDGDKKIDECYKRLDECGWKLEDLTIVPNPTPSPAPSENLTNS